MVWHHPLNSARQIGAIGRFKAVLKSELSAIRIITLAFVLLPLTSVGQIAAGCKGPASIEQTIATHPSPGAYDALGSYFASRNNFPCAISAFESALKIDPKSSESHYDLGIALLASGNPNHAVSELQSASRLKPNSAAILLPLGTALSAVDRQDEAIAAFQTILKIDPKSVPAMDGLTKAYIAQKRYTAAIAELKNAPLDDVLQLNLAVAYSQNGDTADAQKVLAAIVVRHPAYSQAHLNLGIIYTQQNLFAEAAAEFKEAYRLDPSDEVACLSYVKTLVVLSQFDAAEPIVHGYLQRHPTDFDALYFTGVVERNLGKNTEAEAPLKEAVAINPDFFDARYNYGFVLSKLGKFADARVQLEAALKLSPDSEKARFQLATVLRSLGETTAASDELKTFQKQKEQSAKKDVAGVKANQANAFMQSNEPAKAAALYRESIADDPTNARMYYDLSLALDRMADYPAEKEALDKAIALDPKLAVAQNQIGLLALKAGRANEAEGYFKTAISLDPQYAEAQNNLGVLYGQMNKENEAEQLFKQATENNPQYGQAFANLGIIQASQSRYPEALQTLQRATELDPKNPGTLSAYGMVLVRLNRGPEALPSFRKVVELDPKAPGAHLNLGIALADQFDLNGALAEFTEAVKLAPEISIARYNKGRVLLDLQRNAEAKPELEAATRLDPNAADAWYLLGLIARQAADTDAAINDFQKALAVRSDNPEALFMLGQEMQRKGDTAGAIANWRKAIALRPQYSEAYYSLSRLVMKSDPQEGKRLQAQFEQLQAQQHIMDRSSTLGNFALASADAHDWPQAIAQLKEGIQTCGGCSALGQLHKDLGLIYCHSGDYAKGRTELLEAQKLSPSDEDIKKALSLLPPAGHS